MNIQTLIVYTVKLIEPSYLTLTNEVSRSNKKSNRLNSTQLKFINQKIDSCFTLCVKRLKGKRVQVAFINIKKKKKMRPKAIDKTRPDANPLFIVTLSKMCSQ